jgi:transcriptional regulator with XRE-family HTH domain
MRRKLMPPLRVLRLNKGLSQAELAALAGVSEYTVTRLETGQRKRPHPATRRKLAAALGVPIADVDELRANGGPGAPGGGLPLAR